MIFNDYIDKDKNIQTIIYEISLKTTRILSFIGIPALILISYQDIYIYEVPVLVLSRIITIVVMAIYLILSYTNIAEKRKYVILYHYFILISIIMMACNSVITIFSKIDSTIYHKMWSINALIGVIIILYLFSGYLKYFYFVVILPQIYLYTMLILYINIDITTFSLFTYPIVISALLLFLFYYKKVNFVKQYILIKRNEIQKQRIKEKLNTEEELNAQLNKLNNELEKEIKEKEVLQRKLKKRANIDELTSLLNRRAMFEVIQNIFKYDRKRIRIITICFIDVDNLKYINDNFGHKEGDSVLFKIGKALKESVRDKDYAGRIGGDEFLIYFENLSEKKAMEVLKRITGKIDEENNKITQNYKMSISFGCIQYDPEKHQSIDDMVYDADKKMYKQKKKKRKKN